jgi:hypothetical protein
MNKIYKKVKKNYQHKNKKQFSKRSSISYKKQNRIKVNPNKTIMFDINNY